MTAMPIRPVNLPTVIKNQPNGAVPTDLLEVVDRPGYVYMMASLPARGMRAIHAAILEHFGVRMSTTGRGRTLYGQWDIFCGNQARYEPCSFLTYGITSTKNRKSWSAAKRAAVQATLRAQGFRVTIPDSTYWRKIKQPNGSYPATAALPGDSNHGRSCADDLALPDDADPDTMPENITDRMDILEWLYVNEVNYGFAHELASEKWHVHWIAGDVVPAAVLAYEASLVKSPPAPEQPDVPERPADPVIVPTPPATNGDPVFRIVVVDCPHPTIPDAKQRAAATFYGLEVDPGGIIPELEWTGNGNIAKVAHRLATYRALGVETRVLNLEDVLGSNLKGGAGGLPQGDWFAWSLDHFANPVG